MLAAEKLRRLAKDDGCAQVHQLIGNIADHAVGGHARGGVGAAAFDGHGEVGNIRFLALHAGNGHCQPLRGVDARLNGAGSAAQLLHADNFHGLARRAQLFKHALVIGALAAEADDQRRADVRAFAEVNQHVRHAPQIQRQLATSLMMAIADRPLHLAADRLRDIVGADDAGNYGHKISRAEFSVRPPVAKERISHGARPPSGRRAREALPGCEYERIRPF